MPKSANNNIASKIIAFLRETAGHEVEMGISSASTKFDCDPPTICRTLGRLRNAGIIKVTTGLNHQRPNRYALNEEFREEGDGWREALKLKRKSSGGKSEQSVPAKAPVNGRHDEECLGARKVLLEELVETHERLKAAQKEIQALRSTAAGLQKRVEDLEGEIESRNGACRQLRNDVNQLETRLLALRSQTSKPLPKATGKNLTLDGSGVIIMPNEGLPDTR